MRFGCCFFFNSDKQKLFLSNLYTLTFSHGYNATSLTRQTEMSLILSGMKELHSFLNACLCQIL